MPVSPDTIVLIHSLCLTARSWEGWAARYESRGYTVVAPGWPGLQGDAEAPGPDPGPARLHLGDVVDGYDAIVRGLATPPVIVGHAIGGTITQILLSRGVGAVGVGLAPVPIGGARRLLRTRHGSAWPVLPGRRARRRAAPLDPVRFHRDVANTLTREESDLLRRRYHVPASRRGPVHGALADVPRRGTDVDRRRGGRPPLLLVGFGEDRVVPVRAVQRQAAIEGRTRGTTTYQEFPGRPHLPTAPGWEAVADHILGWAMEHAEVPRPPAGARTEDEASERTGGSPPWLMPPKEGTR